MKLVSLLISFLGFFIYICGANGQDIDEIVIKDMVDDGKIREKAREARQFVEMNVTNAPNAIILHLQVTVVRWSAMM